MIANLYKWVASCSKSARGIEYKEISASSSGN